MRFSVAVPRLKKTQALSKLRKYRRLRRPGGLRREYKKLRSLLPGATRSRQLRKKVGVVEAAYQYICELQTALLDKFSTKGVPDDLAGVVRGKVATASDIQALALHLINNSASASNSLMRSPFVGAASLLPPRLVSSAASEMETSSSASTSSINSLPDSVPSSSTDRLSNNNLSDLESASEMDLTPASSSRLGCLSDEASSSSNDESYASTETNEQHNERLSMTPSLEVSSCSSPSEDKATVLLSQHTATPKSITLSSLQSAMNSILPSSSSSSHSSSSCASLFSCNPPSSSTSMLIE